MIKIGITYSETNFQNYPNWILSESNDIEIVILSFELFNYQDLEKCDGVILSGGVDSHPSYYNYSRLNYPLAPIFNQERDRFEIKIFEMAQNLRIPILGICRGMQLINIALGGTLIQDLEENGKNNHRKMLNIDGLHPITIEKNSLFYEIAKIDFGMVNSAHHQGIDQIAIDLKAVAWSDDKVMEVLEYKDKLLNSFMIAVQWHPERFINIDYQIPFSVNIKNAFLEASKIYKNGNN